MKTILTVCFHWFQESSKHGSGGGVMICPVLLGAVLALPWELRAAASTPPSGEDAPSARMLAKAQEFRQQAQSEAEAAFVGYMGDSDKAKNLFGFLGKRLCPHTEPAKGWVYFFETSIWSLAFPDKMTAVAVFYHPWSDVALVTEWTRHESGVTLADADLIMGDVLRNLAKPPFDMEPQWLRGPLPSHLAAGIASARAVRGFEQICSLSNKNGWRSVMPLGDAGLMAEHHKGVGTLFERNLAGLTRYREDAGMAPVRKQTAEVLDQLRGGRTDALWKVATESKPQVRSLLKDHGAKWGDAKVITCVTQSDEQKKEHTFVVLGLPQRPEWFMSFWFKPGPDAARPPALVRIDMIDQHQSYRYLGSIEKMNEAPERGVMTRESMATGDWLGRLITIGASAMTEGMTNSSAGPVGSLLGGCCDELIGRTVWDTSGAPRAAAVRPAVQQEAAGKPPVNTGAVKPGVSSPPPGRTRQWVPLSGRPQGDGVVARPSALGVPTDALPPRGPQSVAPPTRPPTPPGHPADATSGKQVPQHPGATQTGGRPPSNPNTPHNSSSPPRPPQGNPSGGRPPSQPGGHTQPPPAWHPPAGSGQPHGPAGGGGERPPAACPGGI